MRKILFLFPVLALTIAGLVLFLSAEKILGEKTGCPCTNLDQATGEFEPNQKQAVFNNRQVTSLLVQLPEISYADQRVLGDQTGKEKWIEIDLSEQKLKAWEGDKLFLESLVSAGKWAPTPTGEFRIWSKYKYTKMSGGNESNNTYYYLPNVPYTMYFYKGYGMHGTYWHNNFGYPMSHGCVNLPTPVAEKLFYWTTPILASNQNSIQASSANPGTRVVIHD